MDRPITISEAVVTLPTIEIAKALLEDLTQWLITNDPNGCYTPEDRRAEDIYEMPLSEALGFYRRQSGDTGVHPSDLVRLLEAGDENALLVLDPETGRYDIQIFYESLPPSDSVDILTVYTLGNRVSEWELGAPFEWSDNELERVATRLNTSEVPE